MPDDVEVQQHREGAGAVGDGLLRRPSTRRAGRASVERRRRRDDGDRGLSRVGRRRGADRAEVAQGDPASADPVRAPGAPAPPQAPHRPLRRRARVREDRVGALHPDARPRGSVEAWAAQNKRRTEKAEEQGTKPELLEPIGLHEARHTYVSLMHDAGLSLERIGDYVGHSSKYMTDRYRHLLDGHEAEAARTFDEYLARRLVRRTESASSSGSGSSP